MKQALGELSGFLIASFPIVPTMAERSWVGWGDRHRETARGVVAGDML